MTEDNNSLYLSIKDFATTFPFMNQGSLRWLIYNNKEFEAKCIRRIGRKILINVKEFFNYLETQRINENK